MCGISGIVDYDTVWLENNHLSSMIQSLNHRGPDASNQYYDRHVLLGHNRLSIIDLNESSNQPFVSADGRYSIVFNGEIYNYPELRKDLEDEFHFRTKSDTEVLLYAWIHWGSSCLDKLVGMFAFAVWDNVERTLFGARDRFGVKPFYYHHNGSKFIFSSEIKTLWTAGVPKVPREDIWASYFCYGVYAEPAHTFWEHITPLQAGHWFVLKNNHLEVSRWYDFVERIHHTVVSKVERESAEIWYNLAAESVNLRFRSDVPVGFNLSGGLDSSLLLGLVAQNRENIKDIKAFHFYTGDERYDELPWVERMLGHTSVQLEAVKLTASEVPDLAAKVSYFEDEPFGGIPTLAFSKIFAHARNKGFLVLLDGQGIDESLAGYDYYAFESESLIQGTSSKESSVPDYCSAHLRKIAKKPEFPQPFGNQLLDKQYRDLFFTKIPRALRFNDRVSMMHGTELREPFLDHRLVEFGFALPPEMKIRNGERKWLARKVAEKFIPKDVSLAPKRPLQTPQREWLSEDLFTWASELFVRENNLPEHWIDRNRLETVISEYKKNKPDNSFYIWQYINAALIFSK